MKTISGQNKAYKVLSIVILVILAILFLFPLYWIVTGAFKPATDIYATKPVWAPSEWVSTKTCSTDVLRLSLRYLGCRVPPCRQLSDGLSTPYLWRWRL